MYTQLYMLGREEKSSAAALSSYITTNTAHQEDSKQPKCYCKKTKNLCANCTTYNCMHLKGECNVSGTACSLTIIPYLSTFFLVLLKLFSATKAARLITLPHIMNDERQKVGRWKNTKNTPSQPHPFSKAW